MAAFYRWFTRSWLDPDLPRASLEVIVLRCFVIADLVLFLAATVATRPEPGFHGRGVVILLAMIALIVAALATRPLTRACRYRAA